jgi:uncharacterized protein YbaP (TraB family)
MLKGTSMRLSLAKFLAPLAAAASLALAGGAAQAEPALWVVKGPHATVYLFGSVHMLKPNTTWMTPKIKQAFESSSKLTLEIADVDNAAAMAPLVQQLGFDAAHPLSSKLDAATEAKLEAADAALGLPPKQVDTMRPWLAGLTLTLVPIIQKGYDPSAGVDRDLKHEADARHEPVDGFETAEQQLRLFADLPEEHQIGFLRQALDDYADTIGKVDELARAWEAGDVKTISDLVGEDMKKEDPGLYDLVMVKRNQAFADQIAERLKGDGVSFVAVGAGHLAGPDSVQAFLAKKGIKAERL